MTIATTTRVDRDDLNAFLADRRRLVLNTWRSDGRPQMSPVIGALGTDGRLLISSYPTRAKTRNLQRDPDCAVLVLGEDFDDPWVQLYGTAAVLTGEAGVEALVDYYRAAAGEHMIGRSTARPCAPATRCASPSRSLAGVPSPRAGCHRSSPTADGASSTVPPGPGVRAAAPPGTHRRDLAENQRRRPQSGRHLWSETS